MASAGDNEVSYADFERLHKVQLEQSGVPSRYWPTLHAKVASACYDADETFCMIKKGRSFADYCQQDVAAEQEDLMIYDWRVQVIASEGIRLDDKQHVYLVDHFFSFLAKDLDEQLEAIKSNDSARQRLEAMLFPGKGESDSGLGEGEDLEIEREHVWKLANFYKVAQRPAPDAEPESLTVWYVMDEFGSAVRHSDSPTFKVFPFLDLSTGTAYSVMFPLRSLARYDEVTRDWLEGASSPEVRQCRKLTVGFHPQLYRCTHPNRRLQLPNHPIPGDFAHNGAIFEAAFFASHRVNETLPSLDNLVDVPDLSRYAADGRKVKVFSDLHFVTDNLTDDRFEIVADSEEADILWLYEHFKDYEELSLKRPSCYVNQFPFENVLTVKDLFASLCAEAGVDWYPTTFNLEHELDRFCHFVGRQLAEGQADEFYWIAKPWNLGRGMEIFLSDSRLGLLELLRRSQALPYIVSRYVHRPLLFRRDDLAAGVKFDFRYLVLLRSVQPLSAYAYRTFWLRFANSEFCLDKRRLHDYATHFTVMNYREDQQLKNINCDEFVPLFDAQYAGSLTWQEIEEQLVLPALRDAVRLATRHQAPKGVAHSPQSRAIYAADLVLGWTDAGAERRRDIAGLRASMCEMNFCPDLARACRYTPNFINDIFVSLFLNRPTNCHLLVEEDVRFTVK